MITIDSISAKGFKSFAKKIEVPFGKNYNIFIGPNGSGKSNFVDLITFVLGKSSKMKPSLKTTKCFIKSPNFKEIGALYPLLPYFSHHNFPSGLPFL